jgi:anaerobic magnesium-protoporphyrin IX monomethyl ester cyclase
MSRPDAKPARSKVILVYPKIDHEKDYVYFWMPFSLLTVAKPMLDHDLCEVLLFDGNQQDLNAWEQLLDDHLSETLCIGVSVMTGGGQIGHALELVRRVRARPRAPLVVFGGPHVNVLAEQTAHHPLVDAVLVGPGHRSMPALVEALMDRGALTDVPGLLAFRDGTMISGPANPPTVEELGRYPWQLIDVPAYVRDDPTVAARTLNYVSSLGCVYRCQFCYELFYKRRYSAMGAVDLVDDIEELQRRYAINGVKFYDADWFINPKRAVRFCEEVIARGMNLSWAASINPNDIIKARRTQADLLGKVAASGCSRLLMGMESGSDRVLREVVRKEVTRRDLLEVAREIARNGILGSYTFIVGFPGESQEEVEETYSLIEELRELEPMPETRVHLFAPYPGTPLYEEALKYGFSPPTSLEGWSHFDYYESQTPWTSAATVARARANTRMLSPAEGARVDA